MEDMDQQSAPVQKPRFRDVLSFIGSVDVFSIFIFTLPFVLFLALVNYRGSAGDFLYVEQLPQWVNAGYVFTRWIGMTAGVACCREILLGNSDPNPFSMFFHPTTGRLLIFESLALLVLGLVSAGVLQIYNIYSNVWLMYGIIIAIGTPLASWVLCRAFKFPLPDKWFISSYGLIPPLLIYGFVFSVTYQLLVTLVEMIVTEGYLFFYLETLLTVWIFGIAFGCVQLKYFQYFCFRNPEVKQTKTLASKSEKNGWE